CNARGDARQYSPRPGDPFSPTVCSLPFTRAIFISGLSTRSCQRPSAAAGLDRREAARQAPASLATTTASLPLSPDVGPWPGWKRPGFLRPRVAAGRGRPHPFRNCRWTRARWRWAWHRRGRPAARGGRAGPLVLRALEQGLGILGLALARHQPGQALGRGDVAVEHVAHALGNRQLQAIAVGQAHHLVGG